MVQYRIFSQLNPKIYELLRLILFMGDQKLRALERIAKATGHLEDRLKLVNVIIRQGCNNDSQYIINIGLPWVEFNPSDAPNTVRFYNVMHKSFSDKTRVPYVFTWDNELFRHQDRNQVLSGLDYFSQERLASIFTAEKIVKRPPTASAVHSHVLALEEMMKLSL